MTVYRFEVRPLDEAGDPRSRMLEQDARRLGFALERARTARLYLIEADLAPAERDRLAARLLADPVTEHVSPGAAPARGTQIEVLPLPGVMDPAAQSVREAVRALTGRDARVTTGWRYDLEGLTADRAEPLARRLLANTVVHAVHLKPFHPDRLPAGTPAAFAVRHVPLRDLDDAALERLSRDAHLFLSLDEMRAIRDEFRRLEREPTDIELETLAQTWSEHCVHKTLKSTIRYTGEVVRAPASLSTGGSARRAGSAEVGGTAPSRPGHTLNPDGSITIHNLLRSTVAAATHELIAEGVDWTLSVFKDNSGIIAFDEQWGLCIKVETHNHPSALEPYGGAATGAGGCIRDVIGTGLGAKPIANTSVFCVAHPDQWSESTSSSPASSPHTPLTTHHSPSSSSHFATLPLRHSATSSLSPLPPGCIHPRRVLTDVVAGVRDYGNQMGIPTLNGAVAFDDRFIGNPLVYCGCIGIIPRHLIKGQARTGDRIIAIGGRTGRDGIHGATFSSAELTDSHADEFAHAVQIGNAITEKRLLDAILRARDYCAEASSSTRRSGTPDISPRVPSHSGATGHATASASSALSHHAAHLSSSPLFSAITDCGAGGFSSAVGEMGAELGAHVCLDRAPLKYDGLTYTEIWISEAQERMILAVPPDNIRALQQICDEEGVELADLGHFGTPGAELVLSYRGHEVGRLPMVFLHEGIPTPTREAQWLPPTPASPSGQARGRAPSSPNPQSLAPILPALLAHPNIASKHWIVRQYDHEVQGNTILKPLVGPLGRGPGDASIVEPVAGSSLAAALGCGLCPAYGDPTVGGDPYLMALAALDECIRNLVCVGADPGRIAILDNFCWPSCKKPENLASLVRACWGCYDGAKAYRTPFVSGKDSLNNQFTIPAADGRPARTIEIPATLLITGLGLVPDSRRACSMDLKSSDSRLLLVHTGVSPSFGGSVLQSIYPSETSNLSSLRLGVPRVDPTLGPSAARAVHAMISRGLVRAAHDVSEGGVLVAVAEMLIAGATPDRSLGCRLNRPAFFSHPLDWFGESPSAYILEVAPDGPTERELRTLLARFEGLGVELLGEVTGSGVLEVHPDGVAWEVEGLAVAWREPLDW